MASISFKFSEMRVAELEGVITTRGKFNEKLGSELKSGKLLTIHLSDPIFCFEFLASYSKSRQR